MSFHKCDDCESVNEFHHNTDKDKTCPDCRGNDFTDVEECENCGDMQEEDNIIRGRQPDGFDTCTNCNGSLKRCQECGELNTENHKGSGMHKRCWIEGKAEYDNQCRNDDY